MTSVGSGTTRTVGPRRWARAPLAVACGAYAILLSAAVFAPGPSIAPIAAGLGIFGLVALVFSVRAATRRTLPDATRQAWWLLGTGILMLNLVPVGIALSGGVDGPSAGISAPASYGDLLRLLAVVPLLAGLLRFPRGRTTRRDGHKLLLDVVTVVGGSFMVVWYFVLGPVVTSDLPVVTMIVAAGYPIGDLAMIFGAAVVVMRGAHLATRRPMMILLAGLLMLVVADAARGYAKLHPLPEQVSMVELAVTMTGLFLFAVAAIEQCHLASDDRPADTRPVKGTGSRLPYTALAAGSVLLIVVAVRSGVYPWSGLIAGAVVMTAAVAVRQFIAMREHHELSISDSLTGLVNRVRLQDGLARAVERANHTDERVAVLLIDLNGFKQINDTLGHDAGDQLLVGFARLLKASVLGADIVARLGGDEFAVVLHDVRSPDNAAAVASRIITGMREPVAVNGEPVFPSASIGVAITETGYPIPPAALLHQADMAMYRAKAEPGNTYRFHDDDLAGPVPFVDAAAVRSGGPAG